MHIHILALLLFFASLASCQQGQEKTLSMAANIGIQSPDGGSQGAGKVRKVAASLIYQSADGGHTWQDISAGLPVGMFTGNAIASNGEIYLGSDNEMFHRKENTPNANWESSYFLYGNFGDIYPGRSGIYVSSYERGFYQNISGTDIWKNMYAGLKDKSVRTIFETTDGAVLVGCDSGIYKSTDGCKTWKQVFDGGMILDIVAAKGVLISNGYQGIQRSTDGGEHWENVLNENILVKKSGRIGNRFYAIMGTEDPRKVIPEGITSRVRVSSDGGKTWQRIDASPLPVEGMYRMDARLTDVRDAYDLVQAGEYLFGSFDTGVYRSTDQGMTWEQVFSSNGKTSFKVVVSGKMIYAVMVGGC